MKRTNDQVQKYIMRCKQKYVDLDEEFYSALMRWFIKYDLTDEQNNMLEKAKKQREREG